MCITQYSQPYMSQQSKVTYQVYATKIWGMCLEDIAAIRWQAYRACHGPRSQLTFKASTLGLEYLRAIARLDGERT